MNAQRPLALALAIMAVGLLIESHFESVLVIAIANGAAPSWLMTSTARSWFGLGSGWWRRLTIG